MNSRQHHGAKSRSFTRGRTLRIESLEDRRLMALVPELVADIHEGVAPSYLRDLTEVDGTLFLTANEGTSGDELWRSDGTAGGTVIVRDIWPGKHSSAPNAAPGIQRSYPKANVNGTLYFRADDGTSGDELWRSDGTESGTQRVKDIRDILGSYPGSLTDVNGTLFFSVIGAELWKSDGTEAGTVRVKDPNPNGDGGGVALLTDVDGTLYFVANDGTTGYELWKSDGTEAGTSLVRDIYPGRYHFSPDQLTNVNGRLYFSVEDGTSGSELWTSDGSQAGTVQVKDILPGSGGSSPSFLTNVNGTIFFAANDGTSGHELWKSDGTQAGTVQVKDILPGSVGSDPRSLTNVDGTLFFDANDGASGRELWKSDGTDAGTVRVKDIWPGPLQCAEYNEYYECVLWSGESNPGSLANVNGTLFFTASDDIHGVELWVTDGTSQGTYLIGDINSGISDSRPSELTVVGNTLYFSADDGIHGRELWKVVVEDEATPGDTNGDGAVNIEDLNNVRNYFGETGEGILGDTAPFDGVVDIQDLNAVRNNFGVSSPTASPSVYTSADDAAPIRFATARRDGALAATAPQRQIENRAADVLFSMLASGSPPALTQKLVARRRIAQ